MKQATILVRFGVVLAVLVGGGAASAQAPIGSFGTAYDQDFNTLASTGTSNSLPSGWALSENGVTNATLTYTAGTGSGTTGDTYSLGTTPVLTDRALGCVQSGSMVPAFGVSFQNNTGLVIQSLAVSYTGEEWRLGATGRADRLDFQYSVNATSLTTGVLDRYVNELDFIPVHNWRYGRSRWQRLSQSHREVIHDHGLGDPAGCDVLVPLERS